MLEAGDKGYDRARSDHVSARLDGEAREFRDVLEVTSDEWFDFKADYRELIELNTAMGKGDRIIAESRGRRRIWIGLAYCEATSEGVKEGGVTRRTVKL